MEEKIYSLRKLQSKDLFPFINLMNKIGVSELKGVFESDNVKSAITKMKKGEKTEDIASAVGISVALEVAGIVLENLPKCEGEINGILSSLSGMKTKEIQELPPAVFAEMILDVIQKEEFTDFFKVVSKFFRSET